MAGGGGGNGCMGRTGVTPDSEATEAGVPLPPLLLLLLLLLQLLMGVLVALRLQGGASAFLKNVFIDLVVETLGFGLGGGSAK